jgi:prefoldin subunit 5
MDEQLLNKLAEISDQLAILNARIDHLQTLVEKLQADTEKIGVSTKNMDEHIGFVEQVYEKVQAPFHYMIDCAQSSMRLLK